MVAATLPRDSTHAAVQAICVDDSSHVQRTLTAVAVTIDIPVGVNVYELNLSVNAHIRVGATGGAAAATTDRFLPAGSYVYGRAAGQDRIYMVKASGAADGIVSFAAAG